MNRSKLMQRLHAAGARRGFGHAALRSLCGVESLRELSDEQILAEIRQLEGTAVTRGPRLINTRFGPIADRQIRAIYAKFQELSWPREKWTGWLRDRYGVADLFGSDMTSGTASKIIACLDEALNKGPGGRRRKAAAC